MTERSGAGGSAASRLRARLAPLSGHPASSVTVWSVAFVACAAVYLWINHRAGGSAGVRALTYEVVAVTLALVSVVTACRGTVARLPRLLLAAAATVTMIADLAWDMDAVGRLQLSGLPTVSALMYLPAYLVLFATVMVAGARWGEGSAAAALETVIVAGGAAVAGYPYLIGPYVDSTQTQSQVALSIVSPVGDLLVLCGLLLLVPRLRGSRAIWLLLVGMTAWLAADYAYRQQLTVETYRPGGWIDMLWLVQYACIAAAARSSAWPSGPGAERPRASWLKVLGMGTAALAAPVWSAYAETYLDATRVDEVRRPLAVATIVMVTLVVVRLGLLVHVHATTTERLHQTANEREQLAVELRHQALHDGLTGLANRERLMTVAQGLPPGQTAMVAFIDLDDFKNVNDTLGHEAGDALLRTVADRLRAHTRSEDLVARLGGDEFAILMAGNSSWDARRRAEHIMEALRAPVEIAGSAISVTASIGIAPISSDYNGALAAADMAMYAVKRAGKGKVRIYDETMSDQVLSEATLAAELRRAIDDDALTLAYQPVMSLLTGQQIGCEALVRWVHPEIGLLLPGTFLPVGEQRGMAADLDRWVIRAAARQIASWLAAGLTMPVNVNASAAFIAEPSFVDDVLGALAGHRIPGNLLTIEVTEQSLLSDLGTAADKLRALRDHGVRVALDDFGTGYSGLAYLQELPVDVLKLDKSFVRVDEAGVPDGPLLGVVVGLGHALGMHVTAEGVEDGIQAETMRALGCDSAQGWHWAQAMDADAMVTWADGRISRSDRQSASAESSA